MLRTLRKLFFIVLIFPAAQSVAQKGSGQSMAELAKQYASTGECDKAIVYYEKYYDSDPFNAYDGYLKCLLSLKEYDKAEKLIKKQQKKFPTNPSFRLDLAAVYDAQEQPDKTKKVFQDAIRELKPDINTINLLGTAFTQRQQYDLVVETYLQGRKLLKGAYPFSFELAEAYSQLGKSDLMVNEYLDALEFNPTVLPNIQTILQNKIGNDLTGNMSDVVRQALLRRIQKHPDEIAYSEFLYWLFLQEKDFESALIQARSIDKRLNESGDRLLSLGRLCVNNLDYATAEKCFQSVVEKGTEAPNYITARMELINARNSRITTAGTYSQTDLLALQNDYETAIHDLGKSVATAPLVRGYAHLLAFYLHRANDAISLLEETIDIPNLRPQFQANCKMEVGDIYVFNGQVWDAALIYGQVDKDFKNDAIGREAKYRNARLSYFLGEFDWAKDQLSVLKAATSQLISNDALSLGLLISDNTNMDTTTDALLMYSRADLLDFQNKDSLALLTLDSLLKKFPGHSLTDEVWYRKAQIMKNHAQYPEALALLKDVVDKYPDDILADDALFQIATLYDEQLNDKEKAKENYELLLTKYPGSLFVVDARRRYRTLRGDKVN